MRAYSFGFRVTVWAVLALFSWSYGPLFQIPTAYAAEKQKTAARGRTTEKSEAGKQKPEDRFEGVLEAIRENISKAGDKAAKGEEDAVEREAIRTKRAELDLLDTELRKQFSDTERTLRDKGLPKEILDRHYKFVKHYEDNLKELKTNLVGLEKAQETQDKVKKKEYLQKAKAHLEKVKPPKKHVPLDPNKLPHRTVKAKERTPRLKKEEFEKDFPLQKPKNTQHIARSRLLPDLLASRPQHKPVLLAFNETASDVPLSLGAQSLTLQIALTDSSPFLLAQQTADLPTPADLAATPEVQFTPEVQELANSLGENSLRIYEFVRNNFKGSSGFSVGYF